MKKHILMVACALVTLVGCSQNTHNTYNYNKSLNATQHGANATTIEAHMQFIAADELAGRDTGSVGHQIAANYVASQFLSLGLTPAGDKGGYFQTVPLRQANLIANSARFTLHDSLANKNQDIELAYPQAFFTGPSMTETDQLVRAELVFVGYGLVSKEFGLDDYADLDVKNKIVVMLSGRPAFLPSEEAAHINSLKTEFAVERGAVGIITLHTPEREKVRPYATSITNLTAPSMAWLNQQGQPSDRYSQVKGSAYMHYDAAAVLFRHSKTSLAEIFSAIEQDAVPKGFALALSATLARQSEHQAITSPNVLAILPGSDQELAKEYVVITAHADHIGISKDKNSIDNINNGAMDNAAGVAILLETARMFSQLNTPPKRSILFAVVTGEEKGLLGADYFAHFPTRPLSSLVANVNLDMPVLLYPFADMIAFGANHSSLGKVVAEAAAKEGIALSADPMPEQAIFTRSDHYTLVKKGVPAVFLMTGFTSKDPEQDGGKIWADFFAKHYHKPSDDIATLTKEYGAIRYDAGAVFANINFNIALDIANAAQKPYWLEQSFFHKLFATKNSSSSNTKH